MREYKWTFLIIDQMYLDDEDHKGLIYWFEDVKEMIAEMNKK